MSIIEAHPAFGTSLSLYKHIVCVEITTNQLRPLTLKRIMKPLTHVLEVSLPRDPESRVISCWDVTTSFASMSKADQKLNLYVHTVCSKSHVVSLFCAECIID